MYEFLDAKDVFKKYPEKWSDRILSLDKWKEKVDQLEELVKEI